MLTLIIILISTVVGAVVGREVLNSTAWSVTLGLVGFFGSGVPISFWVKKRLEAVFNDVQDAITRDQESLRRRMNAMQNKIMGSTKGLQRQLEKKQGEDIRKAIDLLDQATPLYKWNVLARRQVNTLRGQLLFQIKEFKEADKYLEKAIVMDPFTYAIKMVRQYKNGDVEGLEKSYKKGAKRFKYEKGTLIHGLYTWILVKEGRIDEAVKILAEVKESTEDEVLTANWEHLVNGREKQFSNAGIGDQWYALHLELPKAVKVKQRGGRRRFR